jgi:hypothetical protein
MSDASAVGLRKSLQRIRLRLLTAVGSTVERVAFRGR